MLFSKLDISYGIFIILEQVNKSRDKRTVVNLILPLTTHRAIIAHTPQSLTWFEWGEGGGSMCGRGVTAYDS